MESATKKPGDELREKNKTSSTPPKHSPQKEKQTGEQADELGVIRGQNAEKGNTERRENIRTEDQAEH